MSFCRSVRNEVPYGARTDSSRYKTWKYFEIYQRRWQVVIIIYFLLVISTSPLKVWQWNSNFCVFLFAVPFTNWQISALRENWDLTNYSHQFTARKNTWYWNFIKIVFAVNVYESVQYTLLSIKNFVSETFPLFDL